MKRLMTILGVVVCVAAASTACNRAPNSTGTAGGVVRVTELDLGRSLTADKRIGDTTADFKPTDTIYASVETDGTAPEATLRARWSFQDGQVVKEMTERIAPSGKARTEFHISKADGWPAGKYKVEVSLDGVPARSKDFEVK